MTPAVEAAKRAGIDVRAARVRRASRSVRATTRSASRRRSDRPPAQLFKTLVAKVDGELAVFVVPADRQLDLRAVGKRAELAAQGRGRARDRVRRRRDQPARPAQAAADDGRRVGLEWETVLVSAGRRGLQIELAPPDLIALTGARVAEIAR